MPDEVKTERKKVKVVEVGERKPFGDRGATKLDFKALVDDKTLPFQAFNNSFDEHIKKDAVFELEWETKVRETQDGSFTNRKVIQIYIDGQPIKGKEQYRGGGGYRESPEQRVSIEGQKAADLTMQGWISGKFGDDDPEVKALRKWLKDKLNPGKPEPTKSPVKTTLEEPKPAKAKETTVEDLLFDKEQGEPPEPVPGQIINMTWLRNLLYLRKWKDITMTTYLRNTYKVSGEGTVEDVIARLSEEQQKALLQEAKEWEKML